MDNKIISYLESLTQWKEEINALRTILLETELVEEFKWGQPCYTFQNKNILIIGNFKSYLCIGFFKGGLMKDPKGVLVKAGENTQQSRQMRFENTKQIKSLKSTLKSYIKEAIAIEQAGLTVKSSTPTATDLPEELQQAFKKNTALKTAFNQLTPGRQRGYIIFFSAPKQSATRETRINKYTQRILDGKGFNDCVCGLSKKMPACDGSHKFLTQ